MPAAFLSAWDRFLETYGWRGPGEMDLANPRYADDPRMALQQIASMVTGEAGFDPGRAHARRVEERRQAYAELMGRLGRPRRTFLRHVYRVLDAFAGARDTPKHHNLLWYRAVRARVLMEGERLKDAGRLDAAEDVFGLRLDDVEAARKDVRLDLRQRREERTRFLKKLDAHVRSFPLVIDSRGRILRPPPSEDAPGLLRGTSVSPGVVAGQGPPHAPREARRKGRRPRRLRHRSGLDAAVRERGRRRARSRRGAPARGGGGARVREAVRGRHRPGRGETSGRGAR